MGEIETIVPIILFNLFFIFFIVGIIIFIHQYKLKKKEHLLLLTNQEEAHQKELLETQLEIQQQTMQHIGREIHDNIGQKLTLASLYTQQLNYENKAPHISDNIETISAIINESLSELRELSKSLTNNTIDNLTIIALLEDECLKINELKICDVHFQTNVTNIHLPYQAKSILLRITQEFLQNSIKHAKCKNIHVVLKTEANSLTLFLQDDGKGFTLDLIKSNGIGLSNIKKRTEIIGGKFNLNSNEKEGTQVTIIIPINE
jgi:signal transduction histidine kinase